MANEAAAPKLAPPWWADLLCGAVGGCVGIAIGHPFDTIKVRLQANVFGADANALKCLRMSVQQEGVRSLFAGLASPIVGNVPMQAITFGVYGNALRWIENEDEHVSQSSVSAKPVIWNVFVAGHLAGLVQLPVVVPAEHFKIALQNQRRAKDGSAHYRSSLHYAKEVYRQTGPRGLFKGFNATAARDFYCLAFGVYYVAYEATRQFISTGSVRWHGGIADADTEQVRELSPLSTWLAGGIAGCATWTVAYPFDVIKSRVQAVSPMDQMRTPWVDVARQIYREAGVRGFTRGYGTTMARCFPVNGATFLIYEACLSLL